MKKHLTKDDIRDVYIKAQQRGVSFILSKLHFSKSKRTVTAFNASAKQSANWWDIPYVRERWNKKISSDKNTNHDDFLVNEVLKNKTNLSVLSLGSGISSHEIKLAKSPIFKEITCLDLSEYRMKEAQNLADKEGLKNIKFICANVYTYDFSNQKYDFVLFNSSLHHFENVSQLIEKNIIPILKEKGGIIINEYVGPNRLQFPKEQIHAINGAIQLIPKKYRKRFKTNLYKNSFSGSGVWRMIIADPSECIDSIHILPALHSYFEVVVEKAYGGNILANVLKDIAHHFYELDIEKKAILEELFAFEDKYLENHPSDFVFGVYQLKN